MKTAFFYLRIFLGLTILGFGAWIFWPMERANFDWAEEVSSLMASGECARAQELLVLVAEADPAEARTFLIANPDVRNCDLVQSLDTRLGQLLGAIPELLRVQYPGRQLGVFSARAALFWDDARETRSNARRGLFALPEFIVQYRCLHWLTADSEPHLYRVRIRTAMAGFDIEPPAGAIRRARWCSDFMETQVIALQQDDGEDDPVIAGLISEYRLYQDYIDSLFVLRPGKITSAE